MKIYIASFEKGDPNLARVTVQKETPKTYKLIEGSTEMVLGWLYAGAFVHKEQDSWFIDKTAAMQYLLDRADEYIEACEKKLTKAKETRRTLRGSFIFSSP